MMEDSISTLASTPPPKTKIRFTNIIAADREIMRLENRISTLETLLVAKNTEMTAQVAAPVAPEKFGRERFTATTCVEGQAATPPATSIPAKRDGEKISGRAKFAANVKII